MAKKKPKSKQTENTADKRKKAADTPEFQIDAKLTGIRKSERTGSGPTLETVRIRQSATSRGASGLLQFTLDILYKYLYILGVTILRRLLRYRRRIRRVLSLARGRIAAISHRAVFHLQRWRSRVSQRIAVPRQQIADYLRQQQPALRQAKQLQQFPAALYLQIASYSIKCLSELIFAVLNYIAPIAAIFTLLWVVNTYVTTPFGLQVTYKGQELGLIRSEVEYEEATQAVRSRIVTSEDLSFINESPSLTLVRMKANSQYIDDNEELANRIIEASGGEILEAYGFYVDKQFHGAVVESAPLLTEMEAIRDENRVGLPDEQVQFVKNIRVAPGLYPESSLRSTDSLIELIHSLEATEQIYVVQEGDSPTYISSKLGVPYSLLLQMNPEIEDSLQIGDELLIAAATPFLPVQNVYTNVYEEEFNFPEEEIQNAIYARGYRAVLQEGVKGLHRVTERVTELNGIPVNREVIATEILQNAVPQRVTVGTSDPSTIVSGSDGTDRTPSAATSSGFIWPTTGGRATTYPNHSGNGVDIAIGHGVPIYASASGQIALVKYGISGYGNYIIIDHQNGYRTLYAHNSSIYVSIGDYVNQGDVIAAMGRTGWATGNHLHFEVHYNGRYMWPPDFIGYSA